MPGGKTKKLGGLIARSSDMAALAHAIAGSPIRAAGVTSAAA